MALLQAGDLAPSFKGLNLTGPEFQLDNLKGKKPVVLVFSPDQINPVQIKVTAGVYDKHRNEAELVIISRKLPSIAMAKMALMSAGAKFPSVYDPKQEIYKLYGVEKPVVIFSVNMEGRVSSVGEFDPKGLGAPQLEEALQKAT